MSWIRVDEKTFVGKPKRLNEIDKRPSDIRPSVVSIWWNGKDYLKRIVPILSTFERRIGSQFHHSHNKSGGFTNSFAHSFFALLSLGNCALKNSTLMSNNNNNNKKKSDDETLASSMKQSTQLQKGKAKYKEIRPK